MIFSVDKATNRLFASLPGVDGDTGRYVCDTSACPNPVCTCGTICLDLRPIDGHGTEIPAGSSRHVSIDIARRKIVKAGTLRTPTADIGVAQREEIQIVLRLIVNGPWRLVSKSQSIPWIPTRPSPPPPGAK